MPGIGGAAKQLGHGRDSLHQAVLAAVLARTPLALAQGLDMLGDLDLGGLVVAAHMFGQHQRTVHNAHPLCAGQHAQAALHMGVGDGVVVQIKAHIGRLARVHLHALLQRVGIIWQGHQAGPLFVQGGLDADLRVFGPSPVRGGPLAPGARLGVELVYIAKLAGSKEVLPDVAYRALHAPLLVATCHGHRTRLKAVVGGKGQVLRVKANGVAHALEHGAFEVVAQDHAGHTTKGLKGQHMAAQKAVHAGVEEEVQEDAP